MSQENETDPLEVYSGKPASGVNSDADLLPKHGRILVQISDNVAAMVARYYALLRATVKKAEVSVTKEDVGVGTKSGEPSNIVGRSRSSIIGRDR